MIMAQNGEYVCHASSFQSAAPCPPTGGLIVFRRVAMTAFELKEKDMTTPSSEHPPPQQEQAYPGRTGEIAASYVFFASGRLSSYYPGEVLAPIGGETLPG
jgi:hypothetical protein